MPRLAAVSTVSVLLAGARLALGLAALAGSLAAGTERAVALSILALGAVVFVFWAVSNAGRVAGHLPHEVQPAPPEAVREPLHRTVLGALFPSTVGLVVLAAVSLVLDARLAALAGGILVGLGAGALMTGVRIRMWERARGVTLLVAGDGGLRRA